MAAPNVDLFDEYFRRADLDRDGRISGVEAVAFSQGSGLPKPVLAQVWMHADQNKTGFLGRAEFYNFLKLVTVAQSGRALTLDIVKSALYGPAAAKIPPPKINSLPSSTPQLNAVAAAPAAQANLSLPPSNQFAGAAPNAPQNIAVRPAHSPQSFVPNQQFFPTANNNARPPQAAAPPVHMPGGSVTNANLPNSSSSNISADWLGGKASGGSLGGTPQMPMGSVTLPHHNLGPATGMPPAPAKPQIQSSVVPSVTPRSLDLVPLSSTPSANESKSPVAPGNSTSSGVGFGGDVFSSISQPNSNASALNFSGGTMPNSMAPGSQNSVRPGQVHPVQGTHLGFSGASQFQQTQPNVKQNPLDVSRTSSTSATPNVSVGLPSSAPNQLQTQWPKITQSDIKKYTNVFINVDKDRDGRITGDQARDLFISWRLPREVLKQVWDLSDQDSDSMLTLREFCIALYLMERYREGKPLPATLPSSLMYDETLLRATGLPSGAYGGGAWQPGFAQQGIPGSRPVMPGPGARPQMHNLIPPQPGTGGRQMQQTPGVPGMDNHLVNRSVADNQTTLVPKNDEVVNSPKKGKEMEKHILDSREKIEFYRTTMQELVLYKSRCDNRLNEITERASADKRDVESLGKKYEEKYKQIGELASKLAVEEARYRDIQERKMELQNAIQNVEHGGSTDGLLQVRVDRINSDLEELEKALVDRAKHHGLQVKTTTSIELPTGWEPISQENAAVWDENWDKFEDEGFTVIKDLLNDSTKEVSTANPTSPSMWSDADDLSPVASSSNADRNEKSENTQIWTNGSAYDHSEEGSIKSPSSTPGRSTIESPFNTTGSAHDTSPHAKESHSEHGGAESTISGDKDDLWAFDDTDSMWGADTIDLKESDHTSTQNSFFMSNDFGSIKVDSPSGSSVYGKEKKSLFFEESVPSSPAFSSASPRFNDGFNSFSRFDSFTTHGSGAFPSRENFSRFDSISSNRPETLSRFDSINSTSDFGRNRFESFDDADPFGSSGPFKSSESHSPKHGSDNWKAF